MKSIKSLFSSILQKKIPKRSELSTPRGCGYHNYDHYTKSYEDNLPPEAQREKWQKKNNAPKHNKTGVRSFLLQFSYSTIIIIMRYKQPMVLHSPLSCITLLIVVTQFYCFSSAVTKHIL